MKEKTMINDLTTGSVAKTLIVFAYPFMLSNLLQVVYNMADMIVMGQFVGKTGLSAVSIGGDILHMLTLLALGFASAGQVLISQYVGAGDKAAIKNSIGTLFTFILSSSIVVSVFCFIFGENMLRAMNAPPETYDYAYSYIITCFAGLFFIYGYNTVSAILRGMGDSKRPFIFIAIAAVTNLLLDLLFVAVFDMAAFGAALATVIGQGLSFVLSIIYLYRRRDEFGFDFKPASFKIDGDKLKRLLRLGVPMCLEYGAISLSMLFVNSYLNAYGVVASAVSGIGNKLGNIASVVTGGLSLAGSSMIGQCVGAGKLERVKKVITTSLLLGLVSSALLSILMLLFPNAVFGLFNSDPEVLGLAYTFIPCAILLFFGFAARAPFLALINGIGFAAMNMFVGILDGVVFRVGLALLMGITFGMGIHGFWYGHALAGFVPFIIGGIFYISGKWKTRKLLIE